AKPARRLSGVVMALAAAAIVAAAGAFFALRGGTERTATTTEASPTQMSAAAPAMTPQKEATPPAAPAVAAPNPAPPPPAPAEASATAAPSAAAAPTGTSDREVELAFWKSIKDSTIAADFEAYLEKYPNGDFAAVARNRIAAMKAAQTTAVAPPAKVAPAPAPAPAPELEVIDNDMVAARAAPLREAPDITAKQVGRLKDGERVHVAGKVKGGEWYAVALKGDALAYVATIALESSEVYQARKEKEQEAQQQQAVKTAMAPKALAPAPAAAPAAPKPSGVSAYNGTWRGTMSCEASSYGPAFKSDARPFTVTDGHVSGDYDVPGYGTGGHEVYSGKVDADGNFTVTGQGENGKVGKYPIEFSGKITDVTLVGDGRMGFRHCKISYQR
ncbi:MAG TPA: SH3 domain-containing protein, partial [Alphaproteobacteria bacterium]|nr:SH3 domain-containing protein [Alphaproteobacteria bacterium]